MTTVRRTLLCIGAVLSFLAAISTAEPESGWPDGDLEERVAVVSDRELHLLPEGVPVDTHLHENRIRIGVQSLADGWVALEQCHENLDVVPAAQVTFNPERIRNLRITHAAHIGRAWVEEHSIQMEDIEAGARLCVSAESRALLDLGQGYYRLRTGPYMRRFLDGYYPLRVLIDVRYPAERLDFMRSRPSAQPGFDLRSEPGHLRVEAAFEGRLFSCLDFRAEGSGDHDIPDPDCTSD